MTPRASFVLAAVLVLFSPAAARDLKAFETLPYGVTPCDIFQSAASSRYYQADFSEFNDILDNLLGWAELFLTTWCGSGGSARYTILAPTNAAMSSTLLQLHAKYGSGANASMYTALEDPLAYSSNPVQIAWDAIVENHFIPFPVDFYTNKTVLAATKEKPLIMPTFAVYVKNHIRVWTENGVVYGGITNGLLDDETTFVIPKAEQNLIIGPYEKGDDSKIFIYPIDTVLVPHVLPVPFMNDYHSTHGMANYLKMVGPCTIAYPSKYAGEKAAGC